MSALLHRFNGTYASYLAYSEYARRRQLKAKLPGSHIRHDERSKNLSKDTDLLVRQVEPYPALPYPTLTLPYLTPPCPTLP